MTNSVHFPKSPIFLSIYIYIYKPAKNLAKTKKLNT